MDYHSLTNRSPSENEYGDAEYEQDCANQESEESEDLEDPEVLAELRTQIRRESLFPPGNLRTFKDPSRVAQRTNSWQQTRKAQLDRKMEKALKTEKNRPELETGVRTEKAWWKRRRLNSRRPGERFIGI